MRTQMYRQDKTRKRRSHFARFAPFLSKLFYAANRDRLYLRLCVSNDRQSEAAFWSLFAAIKRSTFARASKSMSSVQPAGMNLTEGAIKMT